MAGPGFRLSLAQLFFALTAVLFVGSLFWLRPYFPERVATHFDFSGEANGWMSRDQHLLLYGLLGLGTAVFVIGLCHVAKLLPPRFLNIPDADFWRQPEHYPEACRIVARWSWSLASLLLLFLGTLNFVVMVANQLSPPRLSPGAMVYPTAIFLTGTVTLIVSLFRSLRRARVELGSEA